MTIVKFLFFIKCIKQKLFQLNRENKSINRRINYIYSIHETQVVLKGTIALNC